MAFDNAISKTDFSTTADHNVSLSLLSVSEDDIRSRLNKNKPESQNVNEATQAGDNTKTEHFCAARAETQEAENRRMDDRIRRAFGQDVIDHITDRHWLYDHFDQLRTGFNRIFDGRGEEFTVGQIAARLRQLSGGLIYGETSTGTNLFSTTPADTYFHVYLRGAWYPLFRQTTHYVGPGLDRTTRDR
jgi:hypothetical protein